MKHAETCSRGTRTTTALSSWLARLRCGVKLLLAGTALVAGAAFAQSADLVLQHQDSPDPGPAGGLFTYTMRIDNNGPNGATGVTLTDTLPSGATFQSLTTTQGSCTNPGVGNGGVVVCSIGAIALNAFETVAVTVRLPVAGTYVNNATVGSTSTDPNPPNNSFAQTTTAVDAADLSLAVVTSNTTPAGGVPYTYTLTTTNQGPNALDVNAVLRISFTVPTGSSVASFSGTGYSCSPAAPVAAATVVTCSNTLGAGLAVSASAPSLVVTATANAAGSITASFSVSATRADGTTVMPDGNLGNNTAVSTVTAGNGTDVSITQTGNPNPVGLGNNVTFVLTPRLNGGEPPGATGTQLITVTDTLGSNLSFVSAMGTGWTCSAIGQVVTCTRPGPYTGGNFTDLPTITVVATATATGALGNTAVISLPAGETDTVPGNNTSIISVTSSNDADLRMNKSVSFNPVVVGQAFSFDLSVSNLGILPVAAGQTITVTDTLPGTIVLTATPSGPGWACTPNSGFPIAGAAVSCTRTGGLGVGGTTPAITVPVIQNAPGSVTNSATVALSGPGPTDPNAGNNTASAGSLATTVAGSVDLEAVSKTAAPATVQSGQLLTYVITVRNNAAQTATNVVVTDNLANLLPSGGLVSATPSAGSCVPVSGNGPTVNVNCNVGSLVQNGTATVTLVVRPAVAVSGNITNNASVSTADQGDTNRGNNSASVSSAVTAIVDLRVTKVATPSTATPGTVPAGAPLLYTVTVINDGPSSAQAVSMTDTLPGNAAFINLVSVSGGGSCGTVPAANAAGGTLVCNWATIPTGEQRTVAYRIRPLNSAVGGSVVNSVAVATSTPETSTSNNGASTSTAVTPAQIDILVNKVDSVDPVPLGGLTTYTVTVTNNGPSFGTNVQLTDVFPAPGTTPTAVFSYQGGFTANAGGTCTQPALGATAGTIACSFPVLAAGQVATVTYQVRAESLTAPGSTSGTLSSRVSVSVTETETQLANNVAIENTTTNRVAVATDLAIVKAAGAATVDPGASLAYTLTVTNNGPVASNGAQVIDVLPANVTLVSAPGCTAAGTTLTCLVGSLAQGGIRTFTITVAVANPFIGPPSLSNTATLDAPGDTNPANNSSTVITVVNVPQATRIPTLTEWALILLSALVGLFAAGSMRARPVRR